MTSEISFLLAKGYVPIVKHNNPSFEFLEHEAAKASTGLLGQRIRCHALRTEKSNAYMVRLPAGFFLGVTDTLLQDMSFDILELLAQPRIADFFASQCAYNYDPRASAPTRGSLGSLVDSVDPMDRFDNPKIHLFNSIFCNGVIVFLVLHEIGHAKHGHFEDLVPGAAFADLPEALNEPKWGVQERAARLDREREADTAAACWRAQQIVKAVQSHRGNVGKEAYCLDLASAFLGAAIPVRRLSRQTESEASTHPVPQERTQNIAHWLSLVGSAEYPQVSYEEHLRLLVRLTRLIETIALDLGWRSLTWNEVYRPYMGR
jgi:hypothetical protein